jgi:NodT family efflux transporter outer membrane factor (OMF) lipoprotein
VQAEDISQWWATLNDPVLTELVSRAVQGNFDLKEAKARLREARARRSIATAGLFPTLDASGSASRSRGSEGTGGGNTGARFATGFDAAWELDLFGGVRRSVEAAEANLEASREDLRDVLVSLTAEVALNYIEVRSYQARLSVTSANLELQGEAYRLTQSRYEAGLDDELAVQQARSGLENTRSQLPNLRTGLEESKNRLAVLLGEEPGILHEELAQPIPIPVPPLEVAVGVPAGLLRRRPDVRQAERELAAQTARIGVATAELYPKLTFNGSIGLEALALDNLFSTGSRALSIGPRITWPIFRAGSIRANIEVQSALQEQAVLRYEATVLGALEEVENALVAYAEEQLRNASLVKAANAARESVALALSKYRTGLTDFRDVLDAQRSLRSYEDQLVQSNGTITSNLVRLYKALGGGWTPLTHDETQPS